jgi:hypothetical protein
VAAVVTLVILITALVALAD